MDVNHNEDMSKELSIMQWRCISAMGHQWGPHHLGIQLGYHGDTYNGDSYDGDVYIYIMSIVKCTDCACSHIYIWMYRRAPDRLTSVLGVKRPLCSSGH